jgi:1-acyl-sn-glycerol-3-phosphate acyltransferase
MDGNLGSRYYSGKNLLITGVTGLVGKVLLETILRKLPEVRRIHVMIRPRNARCGKRLSPGEVLENEILASTAFDFLREKHGEGFASFIAERVEAIEGDLSIEGLGMDPGTYQRLSREVDVVINSAALAVFDAPLDQAFQTNTLGPQRILKFAREAQRRPFVAHISTCYVSNVSGPIFEAPLDPQWTPGGCTPGDRFSASDEADAVTAAIQRIRSAPSQPEEKRRRQLVREGLRMARHRGWKDTYTYTKAMGEQLFAMHQGDVPALILRPSIIESSLSSPAPGWIDGFRMMDPLIVGYGRGQLADFPGNPEAILDVVPADTVVNALLMSIPWTHHGHGASVYQVASGMDRPLLLKELRTFLVEYFRQKPLRRSNSDSPPELPSLTFPEVDGYLRRLAWYRRWLCATGKFYAAVCFTPWGAKRRTDNDARLARVDRLHSTAAIYGPYAGNQSRFLTFNLHPAFAALPSADQAAFPFLLGDLEWRNYFHDVHLPGIERYLLRTTRSRSPEGAPKELRPAPAERDAKGRHPLPDEPLRVEKLSKAAKMLAMTQGVRPVEANAWTTPSYKRAIQRASRSLVRQICNRRLNLTIEGAENIPERGPFILVANHTSHVDTGVLMTALGPLAAFAHPTAAADYWFRSKFLAWLLHSTLGAIPFDRHCRNTPRAIALPAQVLRNGNSLIFYPEGSRSDDGHLHSFRSTLGLLALASGAPILPAYIGGAAEALPKGRTFIQAARINVRFGSPFTMEGYLACLHQDSVSSVAHRIAEDTHAAVQQLRRHALATHPSYLLEQEGEKELIDRAEHV